MTRPTELKDQVDLWMMGEGPHHMHHAKSDVSYALLPKVCEEVEQQHPHIKLATRGTGDLVQLEYSEGMPAKLDQGSAPSSQLPWQRTMAIRHSKELLASDPEAAVVEIAEAVLESALHCCATADRSLLRQVLKDMKLETLKQEKGHPLPCANWHAQQLLSEGAHIKAEVRAVAQQLGSKMPKVASDADLKARYLDFFKALADVMASSAQQELFMERFFSDFPATPTTATTTATAPPAGAPAESPSSWLPRLRQFLESPLPGDTRRKSSAQFRARNHQTDEARSRQKISELVFGPQSKL